MHFNTYFIHSEASERESVFLISFSVESIFDPLEKSKRHGANFRISIVHDIGQH